MRSGFSALSLVGLLVAAGCGDDGGDDGGGVDAGVAMDAGRADAGSCTPTTCEAEGAECGMLSDGCGTQLVCGDCSAPEVCGGGGMANRCGEGACTPTTCDAEGAECGMLADGCGGTLSCGDCTAPQTCGGGGMANRCGDGPCTPTTCAAEGAECGMLRDGCSGILDCGSCTAPATCGGGGVANRCGSPTTAAVRLRFGTLSGVYLEVIMENDVAVAGFQFDVMGITLSGVEGGRASTGGFMSSSSSSRVLGFSLSAATLPPDAVGSLLLNLKLNSVPPAGGEACFAAPVVVSDAGGTSISTSTGPCYRF